MSNPLFAGEFTGSKVWFRGDGYTYPGTDIKSCTFFAAGWGAIIESYKPTQYEAIELSLLPIWADPSAPEFVIDLLYLFVDSIQTRMIRRKANFNNLDQTFTPTVDRRSYTGQYDLADGLPRNPNGRTGFCGRGALGRWGPNHSVAILVTR